MAGIKISELPVNASPQPDDILVVVHNDVTMQTSIRQMLDMLSPFEAGAFTVTPSNASAGTTINSVLLSWSTNKTPARIQISGIGDIPITESSYVLNKPITDTAAFTLTLTGPGGEVINKVAAITFGNYRYWGASPLQTLAAADVTSMSREMTVSRSKDITYDCSGGNYFVYAYPKTLGPLGPDTKVNGFPWNDWVLQELDIPNGNGFIETYYVYRSYNLLNSGTIPVSWR